MDKTKYCPLCGEHSLIDDTRDVPIVYRGRKVIVRQVKGDFCNSCGEIFFDISQGEVYFRQVAEIMHPAKSAIAIPTIPKLE
jgi:HTH-type transcriptional regulator/antitoxin MqsA